MFVSKLSILHQVRLFNMRLVNKTLSSSFVRIMRIYKAGMSKKSSKMKQFCRLHQNVTFIRSILLIGLFPDENQTKVKTVSTNLKLVRPNTINLSERKKINLKIDFTKMLCQKKCKWRRNR